MGFFEPAKPLHQEKNFFLYLPAWLRDPDSEVPERSIVIFFITGNPGLIAYYHEFLRILSQSHPSAIIVGASLAGYTLPEYHGEDVRGVMAAPYDTEETLPLRPSMFWRPTSYSLRDQIDLTYLRIDQTLGSLRQKYKYDLPHKPFDVILMGHSVGAYIALEVVRLHHDVLKGSRAAPSSSIDRTRSGPTDWHVVATMLLTPTIHDIAKSKSGVIATPLLKYLPLLPTICQFGATLLTRLLSKTWLLKMVKNVTGMNDGSALNTTCEFLCTPGLVRQALFMASQEMSEIREDRWTEEVWGTLVEPATSSTKLKINPRHFEESGWKAPAHFFLFAKQDHWIADVTRDAIIAAKRGEIWLDKGPLKHAWCLEQSDYVADIVTRWLNMVVQY